MLCPWRPEKGIRSPGTEVTGGCELPCRCWDLYEQPVLLTAEPSPVPTFPVIHFHDIYGRALHPAACTESENRTQEVALSCPVGPGIVLSLSGGASPVTSEALAGPHGELQKINLLLGMALDV